jgi:DNA-directed RNA polymerase subunit omega
MTDNDTGAPESSPAREDVIAIPDDQEQSVYRFIIVAAKRARQLQSGMRPKVHAASKKMTRVAVEETRRGLVQYIDPETAPPPTEEEEEPVTDQ